MDPVTAAAQGLSQYGLSFVAAALGLLSYWLLRRLLAAKDALSRAHRDHGQQLSAVQEAAGKAMMALQQAQNEQLGEQLRDNTSVMERLVEAMGEIQAAIRASARGGG